MGSWRTAHGIALAGAALLLLGGAGAATAQTLGALTPRFASPGESVTLNGAGFDVLETYTVTVSGMAATVDEVQAGFIRFTVPTGATSAPVVVQASTGSPVVSPRPLVVLRMLDARFGPSVPGDVTGYAIGTLYGDGTPVAGIFPVRVVVGEPTLVAASRADGDSDLLAFATDSTLETVVSGASTAQALVFLHPSIFEADVDAADTVLATIAGLPETQTLAALVDAALTAGTHFLDDPGFDAASSAAIDAYLAQASPSGGGSGAGFLDPKTFVPPSPRDWPPVPGAPANVLGADPTGPDTSILFGELEKLRWLPSDPARGNPLDWIAILDPVDPLVPPLDAGKDFFDNLVNDNAVYPIGTDTLDSPLIGLGSDVRIPATPPQTRLDAVLHATGIVSGTPTVPDDEVRVPVSASDLYVVRRFSGAFYPPQDDLVSQVPGGDRNTEALSLNVSLAVIEALGPILKVEELLLPEEFENDLQVLRDGVSDAVVDLAGLGFINGDTIPELVQLATEMMALLLLDPTGGSGGLAYPGVADTLIEQLRTPVLNPTIGSSSRRIRALANVANEVQAVESTGIVVGEPWSPEIQSFSPLRGHRGTVVEILGKRFSPTPSENLVEFNATPPPTGGDHPITIPGTVLDAQPHRLLVEVPPGAQTGLGEIAVRVTTRGTTTFSNGRFEVLPDPQITAVVPDPPIVGLPFTVLGSSFSRDRTRNEIVFGGLSRFSPTSATETALFFAPGPSSDTPTTVAVVIVDPRSASISAISNALPITPVNPALIPPIGADINVTTGLDNEDADCQVTLREAMHWAVGDTGFRPPTENLADTTTCLFGTMGERDHIGALSYGTGLADTVIIPTTLPSGAITNIALNPALGPLPRLGEFDLYVLNGVVIDGTGVDGPGLFAGAPSPTLQYIEVRDVTLQGFEDGLLVLDSGGNRFENVTIQSPQIDGVFISGGSPNNVLYRVQVDGAGGNGLVLDGAGVTGVVCSPGDNVPGNPRGEMTDNGGWGIRIDGATGNHVYCGDVTGNGAGGILVAADSPGNFIGFPGLQVAGDLPMDVLNNQGHGLEIHSSDTGVRLVRVAGNQGDGIHVANPAAPPVTGITIESAKIGYAEDGTPLPNTGAGIHFMGSVSESIIGNALDEPLNAGPSNFIAGNGGPGIWLDGPGVQNDFVIDSRIGATERMPVGMPPVPQAIVLPNGTHGILVDGGAHDNVLGSVQRLFGLEIVGHQQGAGIKISGPDSDDNDVIAASIGFLERPSAADPTPFTIDDPAFANRYGIVIADEASNNTVGGPGDAVGIDPSVEGPAVRIANADQAGILIDGSSPVMSTRDNEIINTEIGLITPTWDGRGENGVLVRGEIGLTRIGGVRPGEGNRIRALRAGVAIEDVVKVDAQDAFAVVLHQNRLLEVDRVIAGDVDPATGVSVPHGSGVLVQRSADVLIGGLGARHSNGLELNLIGAYVQDSQRVQIVGNSIGVEALFGNAIAGVILQGSSNVLLRGNRILGNGLDDFFSNHRRAGVLIHQGMGNVLANNLIGVEFVGGVPFVSGNKQDGVLILNSRDNRIGDVFRGPNHIGDSIRDGVRIEGAGSFDNRVGNNLIGGSKKRLYPNAGAGVRILAGATSNLIGGLSFIGVGLSGLGNNEIRSNGGGGVIVDGATTLHNTLVGNSIHDHAEPNLGIELRNGGNEELPAPTLTTAVPIVRRVGEESIVGGIIEGTVDGAEVPDGSMIQIFADTADEGRVLAGRAIVEGGAFQTRAGLVRGDRLNATVTVSEFDPMTLQTERTTSEFGNSIIIAPRVDVALDPAGVVPESVGVGATDVVLLPLVVTALDVDCSVVSLEIEATGSLLDDTEIDAANLWQDVDGDGTVSPGDVLLAGPETFPQDDGSLVFSLPPASLAVQVPQQWLATFDLDPAAAVGRIFGARIPSSRAVDAVASVSITGRTAITGVFPIEGESVAISSGGGGFDDADFTGLGVMPGVPLGTMGFASAVSGDGSVIVGYATSLNAAFEAYRWTFQTGMMEPLGDVPGGVFFSRAQTASADGSVIAGYSRGATGDEPFRWTASGAIQGLGEPSGATAAFLWDVSDDGNTAVGDSSQIGLYRWTQGGGYEVIGSQTGVAEDPRGYAVSGDGGTIVGAATSASGPEGFIHTGGGGFQGLGDLPGGAFASEAREISSDGSVIVGSSASASGTEAVYWTTPGSPVAIGDLPGGSFNALALDVSADGSFIVGRGNTDAGTEAFVWDSATGIRNLKEVLEGEFGVDLTGWTLTVAVAISDDGSVIIGNGTNPNGASEPWAVKFSGGGGGMAACEDGADNDGDGLSDYPDDPGCSAPDDPDETSSQDPDAGDANGDGVIDGADYTIWADHFGLVGAAGIPDGDFDGNAVVENADLTILGSRLGDTVGQGS